MKNRPEVTGNFSALLARRKWGPMRPQCGSTLSSAGPGLPGTSAALTRGKDGTQREQTPAVGHSLAKEEVRVSIP